MTRPPVPATDEHLLEALVVGDLREDDPEVVARLAANAPLRGRWQALRETLGALRVLDPTELASVPQHELPPVDIAALVAGRRRTSWRGRWFLVALAATLLLGLGVYLRLQAPNPAAPDPWLGGSTPGPSNPVSAWPPHEPLRWPPVAGAESYRLELAGIPDGPTLPVPGPGFDVAAIEVPEWLPSASERAALPARLRWRVLAIDASNRVVATSAWTETRR